MVNHPICFTCQWFDAKCTISKRWNLVFERALSNRKLCFNCTQKFHKPAAHLGEKENSGERRGVCRGTSLVCIGLVFRGKCISDIFTKLWVSTIEIEDRSPPQNIRVAHTGGKLWSQACRKVLHWLLTRNFDWSHEPLWNQKSRILYDTAEIFRHDYLEKNSSSNLRFLLYSLTSSVYECTVLE